MNALQKESVEEFARKAAELGPVMYFIDTVAQLVATSDEITDAASFMHGEHAKFITGTDLLIDGGVIASICTG